MTDLIDKKKLIEALQKQESQYENFGWTLISASMRRFLSSVEKGEFDAKPEPCIAPGQGYCNRLLALEKRAEKQERELSIVRYALDARVVDLDPSQCTYPHNATTRCPFNIPCLLCQYWRSV